MLKGPEKKWTRTQKEEPGVLEGEVGARKGLGCENPAWMKERRRRQWRRPAGGRQSPGLPEGAESVVEEARALCLGRDG